MRVLPSGTTMMVPTAENKVIPKILIYSVAASIIFFTVLITAGCIIRKNKRNKRKNKKQVQHDYIDIELNLPEQKHPTQNDLADEAIEMYINPVYGTRNILVDVHNKCDLNSRPRSTAIHEVDLIIKAEEEVCNDVREENSELVLIPSGQFQSQGPSSNYNRLNLSERNEEDDLYCNKNQQGGKSSPKRLNVYNHFSGASKYDHLDLNRKNFSTKLNNYNQINIKEDEMKDSKDDDLVVNGSESEPIQNAELSRMDNQEKNCCSGETCLREQEFQSCMKPEGIDYSNICVYSNTSHHENNASPVTKEYTEEIPTNMAKHKCSYSDGEYRKVLDLQEVYKHECSTNCKVGCKHCIDTYDNTGNIIATGSVKHCDQPVTNTGQRYSSWSNMHDKISHLHDSKSVAKPLSYSVEPQKQSCDMYDNVSDHHSDTSVTSHDGDSKDKCSNKSCNDNFLPSKPKISASLTKTALQTQYPNKFKDDKEFDDDLTVVSDISSTNTSYDSDGEPSDSDEIQMKDICIYENLFLS